ncbi:Major myo-inositol transporter IolT [compost metagenome]
MFPILLDKIGLSATFFSFAAIGFVAIAFVKKYLPETKGRTLEQLEQDFRAYDNQEYLDKINA